MVPVSATGGPAAGPAGVSSPRLYGKGLMIHGKGMMISATDGPAAGPAGVSSPRPYGKGLMSAVALVGGSIRCVIDDRAIVDIAGSTALALAAEPTLTHEVLIPRDQLAKFKASMWNWCPGCWVVPDEARSTDLTCCAEVYKPLTRLDLSCVLHRIVETESAPLGGTPREQHVRSNIELVNDALALVRDVFRAHPTAYARQEALEILCLDDGPV